MLENVISVFGEIIDHRYMHRSPILWQRHQCCILATNSIHNPDVLNEAAHLMKVSKISCLEVTGTPQHLWALSSIMLIMIS